MGARKTHTEHEHCARDKQQHDQESIYGIIYVDMGTYVCRCNMVMGNSNELKRLGVI